MKCPIDDTPLAISSRDGVEIDYCPQCRGVWLDRGELDKIIDRAAASLAPSEPPAPSRQDAPRGYETGRRDDYRDDRDRPRDRYDDDRRRDSYKKHKRRSFLEDLFEFD